MANDLTVEPKGASPKKNAPVRSAWFLAAQEVFLNVHKKFEF